MSPSPAAEYDSFAEIYEVWTDTAASTRANLAFYLEAYRACEGSIVELGIGDGRIAIEAALRGCAITGVDLSSAMLERCRQRAEVAGVVDRLTLIQADFRHFQLKAPAALVTLPYHSIGHLTDLEAKRAAMQRVFSQLQAGGRFIFDDFLITPSSLAQMRQVQLRAEYRSPAGADTLLWVTSLVDEPSQSIKVVTWADELDARGFLANRRYRRLSLSWLQPAQTRALLEEAGFSIEACFADFHGTPFGEGEAKEQVWVARKPTSVRSERS